MLLNSTSKPKTSEIDLSKYDIDYYIESDILYEKFGNSLKANPEFRKILFRSIPVAHGCGGRTLDHSTGVSVVAGGTVDPSAESGQKVRLHPFHVGQNRDENPCKIWVYARLYGIMIGIEDSEGTVSHKPLGTNTKDGTSHRRPGKRE